MDTNLKRQDYHKYCWKGGERIGAVMCCGGITILLAYFFYRSVLALIPLSLVGVAAYMRMGRDR